MRRLTALPIVLCLIPFLLALTVLAIALSIALLPITIPISLRAMYDLDDPERMFRNSDADPDDCSSFLVQLLLVCIVFVPVLPLFVAYGAWGSTFRLLGSRRCN